MTTGLHKKDDAEPRICSALSGDFSASCKKDPPISLAWDAEKPVPTRFQTIRAAGSDREFVPPICSRSDPAQIRIPAIVAVIQDARAPPNIARTPTLARSLRRSGTSELMPPIWMPIDEKLAKPQSA